MNHNFRHFRLRLSTLMLLVIVAALLLERWHREIEIRRIEAALARAEADARQAQAVAHRVLYARALAAAASEADRSLTRSGDVGTSPTREGKAAEK
jgi:hypothetical protein